MLNDSTLDKPYARHIALVTHYWSGTQRRVGRILTIYLKNMQWAEWYPPRPGEAPWAEVGFLAVCERAPEADWYVAVLYHEIFLAPDLTPLRLPPWPSTDEELSVGD